MNEVDQAVRWMLTEKAGTVPEPVRLLTGVHAKVRRRRTRRRAVVGALAAIVLLAAGTVAWSTERQDRLVPAARPSADPESAPPSPVTPGWIPAGFPAPRLALDNRSSWMFATSKAGESGPWLVIRVSRDRLVPTVGGGTYTSAEVGDDRADRYDESKDRVPYRELTYQRGSGPWIQISVGNGPPGAPLGITEDDLVAVGRGLVDEERPLPDVLRFATAPPGLVMDGVFTGWDNLHLPYYSFGDPAGPRKHFLPYAGGFGPGGPIRIEARAPDQTEYPSPGVTVEKSRFRAGRWSVTRYDVPGHHDGTLYVAPIGPDRALYIGVDHPFALSDDEMATFISGISTGAEFRCCHDR
ncbi:hypothetical protein [Cryptosporangium japonicum]|uniref:DUF4367 domain-containing protein n=1 Tax=Cryptosporangium japonicum TaxID=80872 RepID=A0ABN0TMB2_9ACTN